MSVAAEEGESGTPAGALPVQDGQGNTLLWRSEARVLEWMRQSAAPEAAAAAAAKGLPGSGGPADSFSIGKHRADDNMAQKQNQW